VCALKTSRLLHAHTDLPIYSLPALRAKICLVSVFFHPQSSSYLWSIDSFFACASHLASLVPYITAEHGICLQNAFRLRSGKSGESPQDGYVRYSGRFNPDQTRRCRMNRSYPENMRVFAPVYLQGTGLRSDWPWRFEQHRLMMRTWAPICTLPGLSGGGMRNCLEWMSLMYAQILAILEYVLRLLLQ